MKKIRLIIAGLAALGVLALPAAASASTIPANFPGNTGTSCNAWHGAPGGFGPDSPYYTVSLPQGGVGGYALGSHQGVITGQNNSSYSVYCNG